MGLELKSVKVLSPAGVLRASGQTSVVNLMPSVLNKIIKVVPTLEKEK